MATNQNVNDPVRPSTERTTSRHGGSASQSSTQSVQQKGREKVQETADRAVEKASSQVTHQKQRAVDRLGRMSEALRSTTSELRNHEEDEVASLMESAAGQIDRVTGYLRERNVDELLHETRDMARREPALFLGGAALLGIVGARFFRSSGSSRMDYDSSDMGAYGEYGGRSAGYGRTGASSYRRPKEYSGYGRSENYSEGFGDSQARSVENNEGADVEYGRRETSGRSPSTDIRDTERRY